MDIVDSLRLMEEKEQSIQVIMTEVQSISTNEEKTECIEAQLTSEHEEETECIVLENKNDNACSDDCSTKMNGYDPKLFVSNTDESFGCWCGGFILMNFSWNNIVHSVSHLYYAALCRSL